MAKTSKKQPSVKPHAAQSANESAGSPARLMARLFEPVDIMFLVYFRIVFGVLIFRLGWQHFHHETFDGRPINLIP